MIFDYDISNVVDFVYECKRLDGSWVRWEDTKYLSRDYISLMCEQLELLKALNRLEYCMGR